MEQYKIIAVISTQFLLFLDTVDSEMFARTLFLLIFAKSLPGEFKVLANI